MKHFLDMLREKRVSGSKISKEINKPDSDREMLIKLGKEQFERLAKKGLSIRVVTL